MPDSIDLPVSAVNRSSLPSRSSTTAPAPSSVEQACRVCGSETRLFARGKVLRRHDAFYDRCVDCGFLQVRDVTWLDEAYGEAIASIDIGTIDRMIGCSCVTKTLLHAFFDVDGSFLDYGAGYGAFVRRMRDLGYRFHWYDKNCDNLFAKRHAASLEQHDELVTAFEVLEHIEDPYPELEAIARSTSALLFSTELLPQRPPALDAWPYYAAETGQHISFYTERSLEVLAERLGLHFTTNGKDLHLFSKRKVPPRAFRLLTRPRVAHFCNLFRNRGTLLYGDYQAGVRAVREAPSTEGR